jgi:poly(beta-D-mannuronate) lyase
MRGGFAGSLLVLLLLAGGIGAASACPVPPDAVTELQTKNVYVDRQGSVADPEIAAENTAKRQSLERFLDLLIETTDRYGRTGDEADRRCAMGLVEAWAKEGSLLGSSFSAQADAVRVWAAGTIAASLIKLDFTNREQPAIVKEWLSALARELLDYAERRVENRGAKARTNIYYWIGFAVAATGYLLDDPELTDWSKGVAEEALSSIQEDGTLPMELERGSKATSYHAFAAQALFGLTLVLTKSAGEPFVQDPRLARLMSLVDRAAKDPATLADAAGAPQEPAAYARSWLRLYRTIAASPTPGLEAGKCPSLRRLGGNVCMLYDAMNDAQ